MLFFTQVPSWLNEKKRGVSVPATISLSVGVSYVLFMILGVLGGLSLQFPGGEDLLASIMQVRAFILTRSCVPSTQRAMSHRARRRLTYCLQAALPATFSPTSPASLASPSSPSSSGTFEALCVCMRAFSINDTRSRYNLVNEGVPLLWANLFAVVLPWALSLFFYAGDQLALGEMLLRDTA